jgi:hypothetical protein
VNVARQVPATLEVVGQPFAPPAVKMTKEERTATLKERRESPEAIAFVAKEYHARMENLLAPAR